MTDADLFNALCPSRVLREDVWAAMRHQGLEAAQAVLADHFRRRARPRWFVQHHREAADELALQQAALAMAHVYGGPAFGDQPMHEFGDSIDWFANPTANPPYEFDKQWTMSFLNMPWWEALGKAYVATGDERYAEEFVAQFLHFMRSHPVPARPARWDDRLPLKYTHPEWLTFKIARRLLGSWTNSFFRFLHAGAMTDPVVCEMLKALVEMTDHLNKHMLTGDLTSNFTVTELLALFTAGTLWPEFEQAATWKSRGTSQLLAELNKQVYPDGVYRELSPAYAAEVLQYYLQYVRLARLNDELIPAEMFDLLRRLIDSLLYISVDGNMPAFGDSVHQSLRPVLEEALEVFPDREDIRWLVTDGASGTPPQRTAHAFPYGGMYVMRRGWSQDDPAIVITAGPYGTAHQHEDCLSFELYAFGDWLVMDPGKYRYNYDSVWRKFMVSSLSHSTLAVDHTGQNRQNRPATWVSRSPLPHRFEQHEGYHLFQGAYTDGYGDDEHIHVTHARSIYFIDGRYWVVIDYALPGTAHERHLYESLFLLNCDPSQVTVEGACVRTRRNHGPNLLLATAACDQQTLSVTSGQHDPVLRGWRPDPRGNTVLPCPAVCLAQHQSGDAVMAALFYPVRQGQSTPDVSLKMTEASRDGVRLEVHLDGKMVRSLCDRWTPPAPEHAAVNHSEEAAR